MTTRNIIVSFARLCESPFADIICYPRLTEKEFHERLRELKRLKISSIEFTGTKTVHNTPVLGKGCVGIVVKARVVSQPVALKIRRTDADRKEMTHEAKMLREANTVNIGPKFLNQSKNFLTMEYLHGTLFPEWLKRVRQKRKIRTVLRTALEQCFQLDKLNLDHGELSHAPKHIIVRRGTPILVDFETASMSRRTQNVTALSQYFFISSQTARKIEKRLGSINQEKLKEALKNYKTQKTQENFETILQMMDLYS